MEYKLNIPSKIRAKKEIVPGYSSKELFFTLIIGILGGAVGLIFIKSFYLMFIIFSFVGFIVTIKNDNNISVFSFIGYFLKHLIAQKIYKYKKSSNMKFLSKVKGKEKRKKKSKEEITANQFMNILDVKDDILYTRDNDMYMYVKINPISINILSDHDKMILINMLTSEFAGVNYEIKIMKISKSMDISNYIENYVYKYQRLTDTDKDKIQRSLIKQAINHLQLNVSGISQNEFYFIINNQINEKELKKLANEVKQKLERCKVEATVCNNNDIIKLINLFTNPNYANKENIEIDDSLSILEKYYK